MHPSPSSLTRAPPLHVRQRDPQQLIDTIADLRIYEKKNEKEPEDAL